MLFFLPQADELQSMVGDALRMSSSDGSPASSAQQLFLPAAKNAHTSWVSGSLSLSLLSFLFFHCCLVPVWLFFLMVCVDIIIIIFLLLLIHYVSRPLVQFFFSCCTFQTKQFHDKNRHSKSNNIQQVSKQSQHAPTRCAHSKDKK